MIIQDVHDTLTFIENNIIYPEVYTIEGASTNPEIFIKGKKVLIFCSNNYLGLATDSRIKEEMIKAIKIYGMGSGGSRLVSGNTDVQMELEKKIAKFKGTEDAITFVTGYMAKTGVIPAVLNPPITNTLSALKNKIIKDKTAIFSDKLNHASIIDGAILSKAERVVYSHKDMADLDQKLSERKGYKRKLIVTDGVFSMDGDIAPLDRIMEISEKHGATVMVDDAHATGVLGDNGQGTSDYFNLVKSPDIVLGTFTKVFGGIGGFVVGSKDLIKYLKVTARTYIFTAPIPPVIAKGLVKSIDIVMNERDRRLKLNENSKYLREKLKSLGFNILESETQIIPVFIGDEKKCVEISKKLLELGIYASSIRWPAVEHGASRLRLTVMSKHSTQQIDKLISALVQVRNEYHF